MQEQVPQSQSALDELPVELSEGSQFGSRLRRAIILLTVAIGTHVWLVHAPHARDPLPLRTPIEISPAVIAEAAAPVAGTGERVAPRSGVRVKTEFISVGTAGTRGAADPTNPLETPVSSMGLVPARSDMSTRAQGGTALSASAAPRPAVFATAVSGRPPGIPDEGKAPAVDSSEANLPLTPLALSARMAALSAERSIPVVTPAVDRSAQLRKDEDTVRRVLLDYTRAFERLDVQAAKALFPSVDDRALQRAFQRLDGQQLRFASCGVSVSGRDANARCRGDATYRPKVGSRILRLTEREWTFNLSRDNDRWQIVNATLQ